MADSLPEVIGKAVKEAIPGSVDNALKNLTDKPSKSIGQTIDDIWFLILGPLSHLADKRRAKYAHDLEAFKTDLNNKVQAIPEEKRIEPNTQVIMGAMDDAKYCMEEEDLRHMFENLIASSVNADSAMLVHPSYSGIIRQMTSLDASVLLAFKTKRLWPIVNYVYRMDPKGHSPIITNIFLGVPASSNPANTLPISTSIDCLCMLGLISKEFINSLTDASQYEPFKQTATFLQLKEQVPIYKEVNPLIKDVDIQKGYVQLTEIGKSFLRVCMP